MKSSRLMSLVEAVTNVTVGYGVAVVIRSRTAANGCAMACGTGFGPTIDEAKAGIAARHGISSTK